METEKTVNAPKPAKPHILIAHGYKMLTKSEVAHTQMPKKPIDRKLFFNFPPFYDFRFSKEQHSSIQENKAFVKPKR